MEPRKVTTQLEHEKTQQKISDNRLGFFLSASSDTQKAALESFIDGNPQSETERRHYKYVSSTGTDYMSFKWGLRRHLLSDDLNLSGLPPETLHSSLIRSIEDEKFIPQTTSEINNFITQLKILLFPMPCVFQEQMPQLRKSIEADERFASIPKTFKMWMVETLLAHKSLPLYLQSLANKTSVTVNFKAYETWMHQFNPETADQLKILARNPDFKKIFHNWCTEVYIAAIKISVPWNITADTHEDMPSAFHHIRLTNTVLTRIAEKCILLETKLFETKSSSFASADEQAFLILNLRRLIHKLEKSGNVDTSKLVRHPSAISSAPCEEAAPSASLLRR